MEQITNASGISVLATSLAAIDRRTLSQAWYSALHVAADTPHRAANAPKPKPTGANGAAPLVPDRAAERVQSRPAVALVATGDALRRGCADATIERRAPRSPLARTIERTFLDPRRAPKRAVFALETGGARVHVALQCTGRSVRLVALCPPSARALVLRALDQARYALAARGVDVERFEIGGVPG